MDSLCPRFHLSRKSHDFGMYHHEHRLPFILLLRLSGCLRLLCQPVLRLCVLLVLNLRRFCAKTKSLFSGLGVDATVYELDQMGEFLRRDAVWSGSPSFRRVEKSFSRRGLNARRVTNENPVSFFSSAFEPSRRSPGTSDFARIEYVRVDSRWLPCASTLSQHMSTRPFERRAVVAVRATLCAHHA